MKQLFNNLSEKERASWILFIAAFSVYALISMTKSAYSASMASIIAEGLFNKAQAGTINASFYLFYGVGQLLGMKAVDKISPVSMLTVSLIGTIVAFVGMAMSDSYIQMLVWWSFCGLVQFAVWPAVLRIISEYIMVEHRGRALIYISFSYCIGMLINYIVATIVLGVAHWKAMFWVTAVILLVMAVLWLNVTKKTKNEYTVQIERNRRYNERTKQAADTAVESMSFGKLVIVSGMAILLVPSLIRSGMDTGLKSWVPTMMTENYPISPSFANMIVSVLVFINLGGVFIANWLYPRRIKNAVWALASCFFISLPLTPLLLLIGKASVFLIALILIILTTMMYAGHQLINVIIPTYFAKYNHAGSVAALINSVASFGGVLANVGFGYMAEHFGWNVTITSWIVLIAIACVTCSIAGIFWYKFTRR